MREGPEPEFYEYLSGERKVKKGHKPGYYDTYKDKSFLNSYAIRWVSKPHISAYSDKPKSLAADVDKVKFKKIREEYPASKGYSLFGSTKNHGPTAKDIKRSHVQDAWFLASVGALA